MNDLAFHQYSPLFTSGLLSDLSRSPSPLPLPLDDEFRSFLLLDPVDVHVQSRDASYSTGTDRIATSVHPDLNLLTIPSPTQTLRRHSRENLPSPKPAPSQNLPDVPTPPERSRFNPPVRRLSDSDRSPFSPILPDSPTFPKSPSARSTSIKSDMRLKNRSAALACLEGRSAAGGRISRNFMNMSDDDDEDEYDQLAFPDRVNAEVPSPASFRVKDLYTSGTSRSAPTVAESAPLRKRSHTIESWFPPFTNFLDFKDDDVPTWRSFIEISTTG